MQRLKLIQVRGQGVTGASAFLNQDVIILVIIV